MKEIFYQVKIQQGKKAQIVQQHPGPRSEGEKNLNPSKQAEHNQALRPKGNIVGKEHMIPEP